MSESAIANANSGPRTNGPALISRSAAAQRRHQCQTGHREQQHRRDEHGEVGGGAGEERDQQAGRDGQEDRAVAERPIARRRSRRDQDGRQRQRHAIGPNSEPSRVPAPLTTLRMRSGGRYPWPRR